MEENSGATILVDSSSYGHDATISGGGLTQVDGQRGYGQNFDVTNDYVTVTDAGILDIATNKITLAAWIKPDKITTMSIIKNNGDGTGYELF